MGVSADLELPFGFLAPADAGEERIRPRGLTPAETDFCGGLLGVDLAYDPLTGEATMSYRLGSTLKFVRFDGSSWEINEVTNKSTGDDTSLAYDSAGNASISYRVTGGPKPQRGLRFARSDGSSWTTELVDAGAGARYNSFAYGPDGNPSIAYSDDDGDGSLDTLKFAHFNDITQEWDIEIVETGTVGFGVFVSLAYDPVTGYPAIAHRGGGALRARFARWDGAAWELSSYDNCQYCGVGASLIFDAAGSPSISYTNYDQVKVAHFNEATQEWEIEIVDPDGFFGYTSLAFDPDGIPSLSYRDSAGGANLLKFARKLPEP